MKKDKNNLVEYHAKIVLDSSDLDKAIEKLEKLIELTKEANALGAKTSLENKNQRCLWKNLCCFHIPGMCFLRHAL